MKKINNSCLFVEIYVGMGKMVSWWHEYALGFNLRGKKESIGKHGLEITYWLQQGECNLLITSALEPNAHDVVSFIDRHGNSIKRFAIEVEDINETFEELVEKNAIFTSNSIEWIESNTEKCGIIRCKLFDDNELLFIQRINCKNPLPGFTAINPFKTNHDINRIDHLASVVRINESEFWNNYLAQILNLNHIQTIGEEFFTNLNTGMKMNVLSSSDGLFNKVIVEPLQNKELKSQVDIFLQHHFGNGIQHLAFEVNDLVNIVSSFKSKGVKFTPVPDKYYDSLSKMNIGIPIDLLKKANILCEIEGDKMLLQVFTEPIGDRPTLFYEFIQRINHFNGFGANNVKQLFESLETQLDGIH
jgi:4-hydroxyphenylpyruvate dioxygenase